MARKTKVSSVHKSTSDGRAIAYLRTSSAANVGEDKDSAKRQREAIQGHASRAGLMVAMEFNDTAVRGADRLDQRTGFTDLLAWAAEHEVRTILVENASRFARDLIVQETGYAMLKARGFTLIAADSPNAFLDDTPTATMIRQILGSVAQFEKAALVAKLKGARDRKSAEAGQRIEGRKGYAETKPELLILAKKLARKPRTGKARSLRDIAAALAEQGHVTAEGKVFSAGQVQRLLNSK
jgi:DNA invertase Pin-like site-specific DNA recombinase